MILMTGGAGYLGLITAHLLDDSSDAITVQWLGRNDA
jgi:UDP-glucose 4-epimerase